MCPVGDIGQCKRKVSNWSGDDVRPHFCVYNRLCLFKGRLLYFHHVMSIYATHLCQNIQVSGSELHSGRHMPNFITWSTSVIFSLRLGKTQICLAFMLSEFQDHSFGCGGCRGQAASGAHAEFRKVTSETIPEHARANSLCELDQAACLVCLVALSRARTAGHKPSLEVAGLWVLLGHYGF